MEYKIIAVFKLQPGKADEEIERCKSADSLLNTLRTFPGFISYEVVKMNEESTMTIQTWRSKADFTEAMPKAMGVQASKIKGRENIVVSYQGYSGEVVLAG
ncbi:MAG TPA: antibiotic biosynthesis monooxygenase family protein [Bacteroidia bacterium]|jgi:heme-degrading monooxygenase HmoA|nr:antibiotic biosynthesis monooxygenase family protein [Bacteroidia bacterium]